MPIKSDPQALAKKQPLPVTIVSGYLGSGKTTLINWLLGNAGGQRLAVLVNDFGDLAIDAQLIESQDGNIISLSGGCVCCSYGNDLVSALLELDNNSFDQIVIEASGVALPGAIAGSLSLMQQFVVSAIVVLADACTIEQHAADKYLADTIQKQLASSDLLALNKTDLISADDKQRLEAWLRKKFPDVKIISVTNSRIDTSILLQNTVSEKSIGFRDEQSQHDASMYNTFALNIEHKLDPEQLAQALTSSDTGVLRVKGFVRDLSGEMNTLQIVGKRWSLHAAPAGVSTGLVCIGLLEFCSEENVRTKLDQITRCSEKK